MKRSPRAALFALAAALHRASAAVCVALVLLLLGAELAIVLLRYCLGMGFLQLQDFAAYVFATLVALGLPVALAADRHVRVDVLRERQGERLRRRTDAAGIVLLLLPAFALTLWLVMPEVRYAWSIREGSRETGGLGGVWLVKSVLPLACVLMLVQGVALLFGAPTADDGTGGTAGSSEATGKTGTTGAAVDVGTAGTGGERIGGHGVPERGA